MKVKSILKNLSVLLAVAFIVFLTMGLTTAYYTGSKKVKGSITLNQGIHFDMTNVDGSVEEGSLMGTMQYYPSGVVGSAQENFTIESADAGQSFTIAVPQINVKDDSHDFYVRAKLNFNYFAGETPVEATDELYNTFFSQMLTFNSRWKESEGYYYFTQANKHLSKSNLQLVSGAQTIDMFASNLITLNNFTVVNGKGPENITRIEIEVELEVAESAGIEGWNIVEPTVMVINNGQYTLSNGTYVPNETFIAANPNYGFKFTINETTHEATVTQYVDAGVKTIDIPNYIILNGNDYEVTNIGYYAFNFCQSLTTITIPNTVTCIGNSAFSYCGGLNSIIIPRSVTNIGEQAFYSCESLTTIIIPNTVTSIEKGMFNGCYNLASVTIEEGVTSIGVEAFYGCRNLTSIAIPNSVTCVGEYAFNNCDNLQPSEVVGNIKYFGNSSNSFLVAYEVIDKNQTNYEISNNCKVLANYLFGSCNNATSIIIGNNVTYIGERAFSGCANLTSVTIPDSVISIGKSAFGFCNGLTTITIPDSVIIIGESAFSSCSNLSSIIIGNGVTSIGEYVFSFSNNLTSFEVKDENSKYFTTDNRSLLERTSEGVVTLKAFAHFGLTEYTIPDSVTNIGDHAFWYCGNLESIVMGNNISNIEEGAFENCSGLTSVIIGENVLSIGFAAFRGCSELTSITIPDSVTNIEDYIFQNCTKLTTARIGNGVNSATGMFSGCSGLTSITFGDGLVSIGESMFSNCSSLTSITIPDSVTSIENYAFTSSGLTSIAIPNNVNSIGQSAFASCVNLTSVTIGTGVNSIESNTFDSCSNLTSIEIASGNKKYYTTDNRSLLERTSDGVVTFKIFLPSGITEYTIPNGVTNIGVSVFAGCSELTSLVISDSVVIIEEGAFSWGSGLTSITIGKNVISIKSGEFSGCSNLTSIIVSEGNEKYYTTNNKDLLERTSDGVVTLVATVSSLTEYVIPDDVTIIGQGSLSSTITDIRLNKTNPPELPGENYGMGTTYPIPYNIQHIYVPAESVETYKSTDGWKEYASKISAIAS